MTFDPSLPETATSPVDEQPWVGELTAVASRMSGLLLSRETVGTVLGLITTLAVETIDEATGAGVTLTDARGRRTTAAATDALVERADQLQYELNEGPCLAAFATRTAQRVDDLGTEVRWPRWAAASREIGLGATLSVPLVAGEVCLGAMKVYAPASRAFDARAEHLLELLATQAAILVANVQSQEDARRMSENLRTALHHRDTIGQAKGILMHSRKVDEEGAFAVLVAASERQNKKLHQVAAELVEATARRRR